MPQFIRFSLMPATAHTPVGVLEPSRTIVSDDSIYVYVDKVGQDPELKYQALLDDFGGNVKTGWTALTVDGETIKIERASGCACGSRLKGFNPFPGVPFNRRF